MDANQTSLRALASETNNALINARESLYEVIGMPENSENKMSTSSQMGSVGELRDALEQARDLSAEVDSLVSKLKNNL